MAGVTLYSVYNVSNGLRGKLLFELKQSAGFTSSESCGKLISGLLYVRIFLVSKLKSLVWNVRYRLQNLVSKFSSFKTNEVHACAHCEPTSINSTLWFAARCSLIMIGLKWSRDAIVLVRGEPLVTLREHVLWCNFQVEYRKALCDWLKVQPI